METFEKTAIRGFSCVNTRLSFDTELLMPNYLNSDFDKIPIDETYKTFKRDDLKVAWTRITNQQAEMINWT